MPKRYKQYASLSLRAAETSLKICGYKTMSRSELVKLDFTPKKRNPNADPSLDAVRMKKSRLRQTALVIASIHGARARFCTATFRFTEDLKNKKSAQERLKYLFKKLKRTGYELEYSGMMERHESGAWHFHFLAYRVGGVLYKSVPAWDYSEMQKAAVSLDGNIDFQKLGRSQNSARKISSYMSKLDSVVAAAYMAKKTTGEDYCYTMTSKGCDLPKKTYLYDDGLAREFIEAGSFRKMDGGGFPYYLSADEEFSKSLYLSKRGSA